MARTSGFMVTLPKGEGLAPLLVSDVVKDAVDAVLHQLGGAIQSQFPRPVGVSRQSLTLGVSLSGALGVSHCLAAQDGERSLQLRGSRRDA